MPNYIDAQGLHLADPASTTIVCPLCESVAHLSPLAVPDLTELRKTQVEQIGIVYRCDACHGPVFLRHEVRGYGPERIELADGATEVERAPEKFAFSYLPAQIESLLRAALDCYAANARAGFALLCRQLALAIFTDLGAPGRLRVFEELNELRELAGFDDALYGLLKDLIFGNEPQPTSAVLAMNEYQSGVLLEVMKDILSQCYVRKARLQRAIRVRRAFVSGHSTQRDARVTE